LTLDFFEWFLFGIAVAGFISDAMSVVGRRFKATPWMYRRVLDASVPRQLLVPLLLLLVASSRCSASSSTDQLHGTGS